MPFRTFDTASRRRLRQIVGALARHGLGWLVVELGLGRLLPFHKGLLYHTRREAPYTQPEHVRLALEDLGVTFIKLGQMLSIRPDLLPPGYAEELSRLQDQAPPVPYEAVATVIEEELGQPPDVLFETFEPAPMASASIGQVHAAQLEGGAPVVVKVQRPGAWTVAEQDLAILVELARLAEARTQWGAAYNLEEWVHEFAFTLQSEFDYSVEGANADRFRELFADESDLYIPTICWPHTTQRVLTMERIDGAKITDTEALDRFDIDRAQLARTCTRIMLRMLLEHGFFHADPHPGNLFIQPTGRVALIDFGMTGQVDPAVRDVLLRVVMALTDQDADRLVDELMALGIAGRHVQRAPLKRDLQHLIRRYANRPLKDIAAAVVFRELVDVARRHRLRLPTDLVLMVKVLAMSEGTALELDPDFPVLTFARPYVRRFWLQRLSPRAQVRRMAEGVLDLTELSSTLPRQLRRLSRQLEQGAVPLTVTTEFSDEDRKHLQRAANRVALSVLTAALVVGTGLLMLVYSPEGAQWFVVATFMLSSLLGLGVLWSIWQTGRL